MNVNRPASSNGDPNAERIARMEALIERSSLGTDGARALRDRASRQTSDRIRRRLATLDLRATLGAVVTEDLGSPRRADSSTYFIQQVNGVKTDTDELRNCDKSVQPHSSPPRDVVPDFEVFPRSRTDDAHPGVRLDNAPNLEIPAIWYHLGNAVRPGSDLDGWRPLRVQSEDALQYIRRLLNKPFLRGHSAQYPYGYFTSSPRYSECLDVFESFTRILSMRLTSGRPPEPATESGRSASETAACLSLLLFVDGLDEFPRPPGHTGSKDGNQHLCRWADEQRATTFSSSRPPSGADAVFTCQDIDGQHRTHIVQAKKLPDYVSKGVLIHHKVSAILNERHVERSKSILESSLSARVCNLWPEDRLTFNVDLKFGDDPKPVGSKLSRSTLNGLLTLMVKHWGSSEPVRDLTFNDSKWPRQDEMLMITSRSEHDGFLLSAFGAIEGAHTRDIERSLVDSPKELRDVAEEFASELESSDEDFGIPKSIIVVDGIDTESPLIRVDGYLTAQGHVR
ncbi:hypothetical protein [Nocardia salmonicida]|uniref:hypothetical protein n=1 Tax=Nocardia salmonicida TaxID=53431 RepID=UPI002E2827A5|nr:hypothetical protein [Nocardia salmonicida]